VNLIWLLITPFLTALIAFLLPGISKRIAFLLSLIPLIILLVGGDQWLGATIDRPWLPAISLSFHFHIDALALLFLYLTAIIIPISILAVSPLTIDFPRMFYGLILLLQGFLIAFFTARDLLLFTFLWEAMLIPLYFLISLWGGSQRRAAALKFLVYMVAGSVMMVVAVLSLYFATAAVDSRTFNLDVLPAVAAMVPNAAWLCAIFLLAFAVKTPLFPFHGWLPDTYYQASTAGTILLSAILSKAGIYGFLRINVALFPQFMQEWSPLLLGLAIAGALYAALAAWMQNDFKRLIAYSSLSHVNVILAGIFVINPISHSGAILQAFNHGITIAALFIVANWLGIRLGSTAINSTTGAAHYFPRLCWLTLFFVLANVAVPGTNNFVGELMIFLGLFSYDHWLAALLALTIILSVLYMLRWMQKVYFGTPKARKEGWVDINWKHMAIALPLILLILWVGIYPKPFLKYTQEAARTLTAFTSENPL
jgi:NADH-quinone oxidoreductase subunit M